MGTKKTAAQIRWEKRKDKVNKARRAKRRVARLARKNGDQPNPILKPRKANKAGKRVVVATKLAPSAKAEVIATIREDWAKAGGTVAGMASSSNVIRVKTLLTTARGKLGVEGAARDLEKMLSERYDAGLSNTRYDTEQRIRTQRVMMDDRIVSAFIARMQFTEAATGTGLPEAIVMSGLEVAKIMDALRSAGYSPKGRQRNTSEMATDGEAGPNLMGARHAS